jgi:hypothetical protein
MEVQQKLHALFPHQIKDNTLVYLVQTEELLFIKRQVRRYIQEKLKNLAVSLTIEDYMKDSQGIDKAFKEVEQESLLMVINSQRCIESIRLL